MVWRACLTVFTVLLSGAVWAQDVKTPLLAAAVADDAAPARPNPVIRGRELNQWLALAADAPSGADADAVVQALLEALSHEAESVRVAAVDGLGQLGGAARPAASALVKVLGDPSGWVRVAAMEVLTGLGADAVPPLMEAFQRQPQSIRVRVAMVLGDMGPEAKAAVPMFRAALADPAIAAHAKGALAAIEVAAEGDPRRQASGQPAQTASEDRSAIRPTGDDWPQFRGPNRDGICGETGLFDQPWPEGGPKLLWKLEGLGRGYSSVAIVGGRLYTMGDRQEGGEESQCLLCYDLADRSQLWAVRVGPPLPPQDGGPRCTPTVAGGKVYAIGTEGDLVCAACDTGKILWRKNLTSHFDGKMMSVWKFSESPLIDGDRLICTPGGQQATLAALDKNSGATRWLTAVPALGEKGKDGAGYSSAVVAELAGVRQIVQMYGRGVFGVEAETGKFLWGYNRIANDVANITSPVIRGDTVFATTSYRTGAALLRIARSGDAFQADEVYFLGPRDFENHHGGVVLVGDHVYGGSGQNKGVPVCLELASGKTAWTAEAPARGSAAVLYADGHVLFRYDRGTVVLVEATPEAFRVKAEFEPITGEGPAWSHPVIHRGLLYLRHGDLLLCYALR